jgi:hypothetical protein
MGNDRKRSETMGSKRTDKPHERTSSERPAPVAERLDEVAVREHIELDDELRALLDDGEDLHVIAAALRSRQELQVDPSPGGFARDGGMTPPPGEVPAPAAHRSGGVTRSVTVRLEARRHETLTALAEREGLSPTAMARMLLHRGIREAERDAEMLP